MLWPESDERRARRSLNQVLLEIRQDHGGDVISSHGDENLLLNTRVLSCDGAALLNAADCGDHSRVVALYAGELMPGFAASGSNDYNDWLDRQRLAIRTTVADSLWELAQYAEPRAAVTLLKRCLDLRPYDETILRRLMSALSETHDGAQAVSTYESFRSELAAKFGTTPSKTTQDLALSIIESCPPARPIKLPSDSTQIFGVAHRSVPTFHKRRLIGAIALGFCAVIGYAAASRAKADQRARPEIEVRDFAALNTGESALKSALPDLIAARLSQESGLKVVRSNSHTEATMDVFGSISSDADVYTASVQLRAPNGSITKTFTVNTPLRLGLDPIVSQTARLIASSWTANHPRTASDEILERAREKARAAKLSWAKGVALSEVESERMGADRALDSIPAMDRHELWYEVKASILADRATAIRLTDPRRAADLYGIAAALLRKQGSPAALAKAAQYRTRQWQFDASRAAAFMDTAEVELAKWLRSTPAEAPLWLELGALRLGSGRFIDAANAIDRARQLDSDLNNDPGASLTFFLAAFNARMDAAAISECDKIRHQFKGSWPSAACSAMSVAWAGADYNISEDSLLTLRSDTEAARDSNRPRLTALLVSANMRRGHRDLAMRQLRTLQASDDLDTEACRALAYGATGDSAKSALLRAGVESHLSGALVLRMYKRAFDDVATLSRRAN